MTKWYVKVLAIIIALGVIAIIVLLVLPKPVVPPNIKSQLTSTLMLPQGSQYPVDSSSMKYDKGIKLLSFNAAVSGHNVVISEQPTPESFVDIPAVYQKVLDGMNDYYDFDVNVGTVHLTTPPQLNGKQAAVLNTKGTLLFAKPTYSLSNSQWQQFFTTFQVIQ